MLLNRTRVIKQHTRPSYPGAGRMPTRAEEGENKTKKEEGCHHDWLLPALASAVSSITINTLIVHIILIF
jgi:hypothetical protein